MGIKKGDVIRLNSGGPEMTVTGIVGEDLSLITLKEIGFFDGDVTTEYFVNDKLERGTFKSTSIKLVK
ncbi:MAG: DUF2158 domain-containing protein [Saccharospirillaceae bacterium]|nr:DUF2158 domain-containing protein [Saccharospirillaceae bacterium]